MIDTEDRQRRALALLNELRDALVMALSDRGGHDVAELEMDLEISRQWIARAQRVVLALRDLVWGSPRPLDDD